MTCDLLSVSLPDGSFVRGVTLTGSRHVIALAVGGPWRVLAECEFVREGRVLTMMFGPFSAVLVPMWKSEVRS